MSRLVVGLDARPALFGRTGFGRVVRETIAALRRRPDVDLRLYGAAWKRARPDCRLPDVCAPRVPARLAALVARWGYGVETLLGELDLFQHTDVVFAPVRRAPEVVTIYDLVYLMGRDWHAPDFARVTGARVAARAALAAAVVVPCERVADDVLRHRLAPAARVHVSALGADHVDPLPRADDAARIDALFVRCGRTPLRPGELVVLVPGTREPRKNQRAVLEAFLARPTSGDDVARTSDGEPAPARLVLAGPRGWGVPELERLLADPRHAASLVAAGEVDEDDLAALLRRADVVAYPSFAEGFGLPVAEALRCGRPVLTARATPMADFGGDAVLAVDAENPSAVAAGLRLLLAEPTLRAELAARATSRAAPLTWASHAERLVHVWRAAVS